MRDLVANTTRLVSRSPGAGGPGGDDDSRRPAISDDATRIVFQSVADNLVADDDDAVQDIIVRERVSGSNTLVSRATGAGGAPANDSSDRAEISPSGRYVVFQGRGDNLVGDDNDGVTNIFLRDLDESTTALASRAHGAGRRGRRRQLVRPRRRRQRPRGVHLGRRQPLGGGQQRGHERLRARRAGRHDDARQPGARPRRRPRQRRVAFPTTSRDGRYVAFQSLATNLLAGTVPGLRNIYRRDVLGDTPVATPACKNLPLPPTPPDKDDVTFTLSVTQLRINQRISQAAIRRLNAVEARLNGGLQSRDLCGYSVGPAQLGPGITSAPAAASLAPVAPADPAPIVDPGRSGQGDPLTLSASPAADQPAHRPGRHPPGHRHHQPPRGRPHRRRRAGRPGRPRASSTTASRSSPSSPAPSRRPPRP